MAELLNCPFCQEDKFDEIGLCIHLASHCRAYDRACRRTAEYMEGMDSGRIAAAENAREG